MPQGGGVCLGLQPDLAELSRIVADHAALEMQMVKESNRAYILHMLCIQINSQLAGFSGNFFKALSLWLAGGKCV